MGIGACLHLRIMRQPAVFRSHFMLSRIFSGFIAIALIAGLFFTGGLHAAVRVFTPAGGPYTIDQNDSGNNYVYTDGDSDSRTRVQPVSDAMIKWGASSQGLQASNEYTLNIASIDRFSGVKFATNFTAGSVIDGSDFVESGVISYVYYSTTSLPLLAHNQFTLGGVSGYLGYSFLDSSFNIHYGWARFSMTDTGISPFTNFHLTIYEWAYEDLVNVPILAGATTSSVPEPATLCLLMGFGAFGFVVYRRRSAR